MLQVQSRKKREQGWPAFLLSAVGGSVDAVGFLVLFHLFVAHMSGNSAALGAYFGQGQWQMGFRHLFPIPLFLFGIALGTILSETTTRWQLRSTFSVVLGLEATLLLLFMLFGIRMTHEGTIQAASALDFYLLAALPVLAMGLQNATLRRVGGFTLHTTYVTGILDGLAEEGVKYLYWVRDRTRGHTVRRFRNILRLSPRQASFRRTLLCGGVWGSYIIGAVLGSVATHWWNLGSLALPLGALALMITVDLIRPLQLSTQSDPWAGASD